MIKKIKCFFDKNSTLFSILGFFITIFGIGLSIWISKQPVTIPQKELSCITTSSKSLVVTLEKDNNLTLMYADKEVSNPYITTIVVQNTGQYPISNSDFVKPFSVIFGENDKILSINISDCSNQYIRDEIIENSKFINQEFDIKNFLLNPNEMFTIDIISDGIIQNIKFNHRLEGISKLNLIENTSERIFILNTTRYVKFLKQFLIAISLIAFISVSLVFYNIIIVYKRNKEEKERYKYLKNIYEKYIVNENEENNNE